MSQPLRPPATLTTQRLAGAASIIFHPAVVMVGAAVVATGAAEGGARLRWQALGLTLAAAVVVMGYSAWQTRSGRWTHIDASERHERAQLNRFASWLLLGIAAILAVLGSHRGIVAAIGLSGLIVLAGHLLRGWLKASLHVAFAMFAACIAWPHAAAFATLLVATVVVAWSRLVLRRHAPREVVAGAALGAVCGLVFQWGIAA